MSYVVYVNHQNNKAIVHSISCTRYIRRKRNETHNGYWTQPFSDFNEAMAFAKNTRKARIDTCAFCINFHL